VLLFFTFQVITSDFTDQAQPDPASQINTVIKRKKVKGMTPVGGSGED
jgi:hypothetical protein